MTHVKRAITAEDLTKIEILSDPQHTPNGDAYTYVSTKINDNNEYESNLYYQKRIETEPVQWTFGSNKNSNLSFSPDGKKAVFQSDRSGLPQLWIINTDGGEARQLTTFRNGAFNPAWTKNGQSIIFSAFIDEGDDVQNQKELSKEEQQKEMEEKKKQPLLVDRLQYKSNDRGFHDNKNTQIILYDLKEEKYEQLTNSNVDHSFQDVSPNGNYILFAANLNEDADYEIKNDLFLLNLKTIETTKLTDGNGGYHSARFSPSGDKIACFGHGYEYDGATLSKLFVYDIATGKRTCLTEGFDVQLGDAVVGDTRLGNSTTGPVWSRDEKSIYFIATDFGATGLYQASFNSEVEVLYKNDNHIFGFSYEATSDSFILGVSTPIDPCNFYSFRKGADLTQLTNSNALFLEEVAVIEPEVLVIPTEDGLELQGWLLRPYGYKDGEKYPFILEVHGGPHAMYGQTFFHEMQLLAAKGYVVLYTNPRGSHGYGQQFVDAVRGDYGGGDYSDLMLAVDYALEHFSFIDENRLGVTGGSYGGFMTNWIVGHTNRFKAAVTQRSISNWLSFYGVSDIGYFFTKWELGFNLLEDPAKLWDFSPLKYVENVETPLLILHGEVDYRCPIEQGEQLFIALKHLRKEVEFVRFPGADHELSRSGNPNMRIARLEEICRWFEKYL
ncbi:S9 family peptidase [Oceanobacillus bengalensis]|uniref:S9 family peptidase n=1 Tax=Oceanobacillus bengalensis TaxID=1435466 RepID=A0A494Z820_9BACI|nr:S9 family peptidase [Oceanobacillus bengalensis]RKQ18743.1 S9 family peptidase [Oceanobacillus bengalensis]